jgi:hypothetical protein
MCCIVTYQNKEQLFPYNSINLLVFATELESVYCAVRTGYLNIIYSNVFLHWVTE